MNKTDEFFMQHCLQLAKKAKATGNTAVGAILVRSGEIISEGIEGSADFPAPLAHAEIIAIINAINKIGSKDLSTCDLYTTVEPCFMCSYLIRETRISKVIYGTDAGEIGGACGKYPILLSENISKWNDAIIVTGGMMADECLKILQ